ncbi:MAG: long-chain acyl-CoA synthetase [Verrucomicrobiales bacterium]
MNHLLDILAQRRASTQIAVINGSEQKEFSYADLTFLAEDVGKKLKQAGLRPGDHVGILLPPSVDFVAAFFGVMTQDAVAAPLDSAVKNAQLEEVLTALKPKCIITLGEIAPRIRSVCGIADIFCTIQITESRKVELQIETKDGLNGQQPTGEKSERGGSSDALILFTSGSSGTPKGVRLSHQGTLFNIDRHLNSLQLETDRLKFMQVLPVHFSYGLNASLLSALYANGVLALPAAAIDKVWFEANLDSDALLGTPTVYSHLMKADSIHSYPVKTVTVGGESHTPDDSRLLRAKFPEAKFFVTYGLTEAGPRVATLPPEQFSDVPGRIGVPMKDVEVRIDAKGTEVGELLVRSPSVMNGYLDESEGGHESPIEDGWLRTGDLGKLNGGILELTGRKDRQFKWRGRRINPAAIERILEQHAAVESARVVVLKEDGAPRLEARVHSASESDDLAKDLRRWCGSRLSFWMIPEQFSFNDAAAPESAHHKRRPSR